MPRGLEGTRRVDRGRLKRPIAAAVPAGESGVAAEDLREAATAPPHGDEGAGCDGTGHDGRETKRMRMCCHRGTDANGRHDLSVLKDQECAA